MSFYLENPPKNLCAVSYMRQRSDTHGGHAEEHFEEMRQIAQAAIKAYVPPIVEETCARMWNEALERIVGAISYDVESNVKIAFSNGEEIFNDSKTQRIVSDAIMKAMKKELSKLKDINLK